MPTAKHTDRAQQALRMACSLSFFLVCAIPLLAQTPPGVGSLQGRDVSVEHPAAPLSGAAAAGVSPGTPVGNGSVITVHSGKARIQLTGGGFIYICGPAKFTLLENGGALTLALEFGRVHVSLPGASPLQAYTAFFTASPEAVSEGPREFALGLDTSGKLCARAYHGAVRLEQQLSGNTITVPEPREIFLQGGDVTPLKNVTGHCDCDVIEADLTPLTPPAPPAAPTNPPVNAVPAGPQSQKPPSSTAESNVRSDIPPQAAPPAQSETSREPSAKQSPAQKATVPVLTYNYEVPNPPPAPSAETIMLVQDLRVEPAFVFTGRVTKKPSSRQRGAKKKKSGKPAAETAAVTQPSNSPAAVGAPASSSAANSTAAAALQQPANATAVPAPAAAAPPAQTHHSFWGRLKHFFSGGKSDSSN
jgi:hypothetical protein